MLCVGVCLGSFVKGAEVHVCRWLWLVEKLNYVSRLHGTQIDGDAGMLERSEDGLVKPVIVKKSTHKFKVKLQDPAVVNAFYRLQDRAPGRGMDSSMLIMSKAMGKTGKKLAMAAPPILLRCHIPLGDSRAKVFPWLTFKHNVVEMDENGDVTFGVKEYPPWVSVPAVP